MTRRFPPTPNRLFRAALLLLVGLTAACGQADERASVGEPLVRDGVEWQIDELIDGYLDGNRRAPAEGNKFVVVGISLRNVGEEVAAVGVAGNPGELIDADGNRYWSVDAIRGDQVSTDVSPTEEANGDLTFEVPDVAVPTELVMSAGASRSDRIVWDLSDGPTSRDVVASAIAPAIGDRHRHDLFEWTITDVVDDYEASDRQPSAGHKFVVVGARLTSVTGRPEPYIWKGTIRRLIDDDGATHQTIDDVRGPSFAGTISAELATSGDMAFEIPVGTKPVALELGDDWGSASIQRWDLTRGRAVKPSPQPAESDADDNATSTSSVSTTTRPPTPTTTTTSEPAPATTASTLAERSTTPSSVEGAETGPNPWETSTTEPPAPSPTTTEQTTTTTAALTTTTSIPATTTTTAPAAANGERRTATVKWIKDGDTIEVDSGEQIRFIGIDTPERDECGSDAAKDRVSALLPIGSTIELEFDADRTDRYDRTLAYLWTDGRMINDILIDEGLAVPFPFKPNYRYRSSFEEGAQQARSTNTGTWGVCADAMSDLYDHRNRF